MKTLIQLKTKQILTISLALTLMLVMSLATQAADKVRKENPIPTGNRDRGGVAANYCLVYDSRDYYADEEPIPGTLRFVLEANQSEARYCSEGILFQYSMRIQLKRPLVAEKFFLLSGYHAASESPLPVIVDARQITADSPSNCAFRLHDWEEELFEIHDLTIYSKTMNQAICDANGKKNILNQTIPQIDGLRINCAADSKVKDCDFKNTIIEVRDINNPDDCVAWECFHNDDNEPVSPLREMNCTNGRDDDGDGKTDCEDLDCMELRADICFQIVEICDDGISNDFDGLVDCADPDCANSPACNEGNPDDPINGECDANGDFDADGVLDCHDVCPDVAGVASNQGCPEGNNGGEVPDDVVPDDNTPDDPITDDRDSDGDTVPDNIDCAPNDPTRYQGAPDAPDDGIDQDCNGSDVVSTGSPNVDDDGDTYCESIVECEGDANLRDCDDSNASIHPGAQEVVGDGIDNNCNGFIDEAPDTSDNNDDDSNDEVQAKSASGSCALNPHQNVEATSVIAFILMMGFIYSQRRRCFQKK